MISSRLGLRVLEHVQLRAPSLRLCRDVSAAQGAPCALPPVVVLRGGVGQRGADVRAAHSSNHCGPEVVPRPDEHVRGPCVFVFVCVCVCVCAHFHTTLEGMDLGGIRGALLSRDIAMRAERSP